MRSKNATPPAYAFLEEFTKALVQFQATSPVPQRDPANDNIGAISWDEYFHALAQAAALKSKDKQKKVGAIIVDPHAHTVLSTGFNGFARQIREVPQRTDDQDEKLYWVTHAEANAIFNAARHGISLVGGTLYVTLFPCANCAQAIVQAGIKRVFTLGKYWIKTDPEATNRWEIALALLQEGHVAVHTPAINDLAQNFFEADKRRNNLVDKALASWTSTKAGVIRSELQGEYVVGKPDRIEVRNAKRALLKVFFVKVKNGISSLVDEKHATTSSNGSTRRGAAVRRRRAQAKTAAKA